MPVCPQCGAEYRSGFTSCSDCRVDLVEPDPRVSFEGAALEAPGLLFPIVWTAATAFAFYRGAVHGYAASLGASPVIFFVMTYIGVLCGVLQSPLIFWAAKSLQASIARSGIGSLVWLIVSPIAWILAIPVGYGAGVSVGGIPGVVIGTVLVGGVLGVFQWPILRGAVNRKAARWILINMVAIAAAMGGSALWGTLSASPSTSPDSNILSSVIALGPVFGAVTGFSLWWLLRTAPLKHKR